VNDLSTPSYPYKAYLENLLSFSDKIKSGTLNPLENGKENQTVEKPV